MARDNDQTKYIWKQGNVTPVNITDLDTEYNLLGFHNNRSVLEHTNEKLDLQLKNRGCLSKKITDSNIITKQVIVKSSPSSDKVVLINDKNVKIPVKKCRDVPKNILKMFKDKSYANTGNYPNVNKLDSMQLTLSKSIRTYEKRRDKPYQNVNTDNKNSKVNKDFKTFSIIKDIDDRCNTELDKIKIEYVDVKPYCNGDQSLEIEKHETSTDSVNKILNGTSPKDLINLKYPVERRRTIDSADIKNLKQSNLNGDNTKESYLKQNNTSGDCKVKVLKSVNPQSSIIIDLTSKNKEGNSKNIEQCENGVLNVKSYGENVMCREDNNIRLKIKQVLVNKQETRKSETDMGKIKHFKEKSSIEKNSYAGGAYPKTPIKVSLPVSHLLPDPSKFERTNYGESLDKKLREYRVEGANLKKPIEKSAREGERSTVYGEENQTASPAGATRTNESNRLKNKRQRVKTSSKQLHMRHEIKNAVEKYIKNSMSWKSKQRVKKVEKKRLKNNSSQTELVLNDNSTQTEVEVDMVAEESLMSQANNVVFLDHFDDYEGVIRNNISFGVGPRMSPYRGGGGKVTYALGNNLDGDGFNAIPSETFSDNMGYLKVNSVGGVGVGANEKRAFYDYLRNCCQQDSAGNLLLHIQVMNNNFDEVRRQALMLHLRNISIDSTNGNYLTPLHLAVIHNCDETIIRFLLSRGADLSCMDTDGNNAMHLAVFYDRFDALRVLLQKANEISFNLNTFNYEGFTPLLLATMEDKYDMVHVLLDFGADANVRDQKSGRTPLFHAVENSNLKMVKLLLVNGANKKIKNFSGTSTHDAVFELEGINPEIKNTITGKDICTVTPRVERRKRNGQKPKETCTKKLETVKVYKKIKLN